MANGGYIVLSVVFRPEDGQWSAVCPELGTAACGDSLEEASEAIRELIPLHLETLESLGELRAFFRKHGIHFYKTKPRKVKPAEVEPDGNLFVQFFTESVRATA